jgi:hypothetical protein
MYLRLLYKIDIGITPNFKFVNKTREQHSCKCCYCSCSCQSFCKAQKTIVSNSKAYCSIYHMVHRLIYALQLCMQFSGLYPRSSSLYVHCRNLYVHCIGSKRMLFCFVKFCFCNSWAQCNGHFEILVHTPIMHRVLWGEGQSF